eukprot:3191076-Prymnesium_polylepis.2
MGGRNGDDGWCGAWSGVGPRRGAASCMRVPAAWLAQWHSGAGRPQGYTSHPVIPAGPTGDRTATRAAGRPDAGRAAP